MLTYPQLRDEYGRLWRGMKIDNSGAAVAYSIARRSLQEKARYAEVEKTTGVPWFLVAALHNMESSQRFNTHLHNGDPLTARTRQVPAGRPKEGKPPFEWDESAVDALTMPPHSLHLVEKWTIERILFEAERYNGWGYRIWHPETLSPYVWSFTNNYRFGKYVADGKWSSTAVSSQCGVAAILKSIFEIDMAAKAAVIGTIEAIFDESTAALQGYLNVLGAEPALKVDGDYGTKTRLAVRAFQGKHALHVDGLAGIKTWAIIKLLTQSKRSGL